MTFLKLACILLRRLLYTKVANCVHCYFLSSSTKKHLLLGSLYSLEYNSNSSRGFFRHWRCSFEKAVHQSIEHSSPYLGQISVLDSKIKWRFVIPSILPYICIIRYGQMEYLGHRLLPMTFLCTSGLEAETVQTIHPSVGCMQTAGIPSRETLPTGEGPRCNESGSGRLKLEARVKRLSM